MVERAQIPRFEGILLGRLKSLLEAIWDRRLGLVIAPPGAGKTTLLASFAMAAGVPTAWYRADRWDRSEDALVSRLARTFEVATRGDATAWDSMRAVAEGLEAWDPTRALLVIDDLHVLEGSPSEAALEHLLERMPDGLRVLAASRAQPHINLSRLRLSGQLLEVTADDLRFRSWEVERLFGEHYHEPMTPEELARLARWTEGWAAGLQLFYLATRGRPPDERRRVLRSLGPRSRLAHEYLAQNVLDRVPRDVRSFLVSTCILGRLDGRLCDSLLGRSDSAAVLDELERRCLFTVRLDDEGGYRYHEVFRSYLQGVLLSEVGEGEARRRFRAAGDLLVADGRVAEGLEAHLRAEAWDVVERLLESDGPSIADGPLDWIDRGVSRAIREDTWLDLARARRLRSAGRFREAMAAYAEVARDTRTQAAADAARKERAALAGLMMPDPVPPAGHEWWIVLRRALERDPDALGADGATVNDCSSRLVAAIILILAGDLASARAELVAVADDDDAEGLVACIASMAHGGVSLLAGDDDGIVRLYGAVGAAEGLGWDWLARVGRSLLAMSGRPDHLREAARLAGAAGADGDRWGAALAALAGAWGNLVADVPRANADRAGAAVELALAAAAGLQSLGASSLEAWARSIAVLAAATTGRPDTPHLLRMARGLARATVVEHASMLCEIAQARWEGDPERAAALAGRVAEHSGIAVPLRTVTRVVQPGRTGELEATRSKGHEAAPSPPARLTLLGSFRLKIGEQAVDLLAMRPRVRALLQLLALEVDTPVHREAITESLWPGIEPHAAARNLHVAIASLRRVLEPDAKRGDFRFVLRNGDRYLLSLPVGREVDVLGFQHAVNETRAAVARRDGPGVQRWAHAALERYGGDLLPEQGPAEWVVDRRDLLRTAVVESATSLARVLLDAADYDACAAVCGTGLGHDRYHDPLWRILIQAREDAGDHAAARTASQGYRRALVQLGVDPPLGRTSL